MSAAPPPAPPPPPPHWSPVPYIPRAPEHPRAAASLVLGLVAVVGFFMVLITVLLAPLAWYLGAAARRDMEREPGRWAGSSSARAGCILGVIGTIVLLAVTVLVAGLAAITTVASNAPSAY